ncbi:MAG: uroporphyrinogen decarboxylase family protein [Eubacteriales bacterium]
MAKMTIRKAKETMSPRERVKRTFAHEQTDRVTIGYETNMAVHMRVADALGIHDGNMEFVMQALGVDYRSISAPYTGKQLFKIPPDRQVDQLEGAIMRWAANESGGYWDFCDFPLKDATEEMFTKFPIPNPDDFNYEAAREASSNVNNPNQYALYVGNAGIPDIINSNGRIMGMEDVLCCLLTEDEAALDFINRRAEWQLGYLERLLDKCCGNIDFVWLGEDLGTQHTPMISKNLYRRVMKPIHKRFIDLAASYELPVIIHSCGSSSWVYPDFIEMGVKGVDTLQPEAADMSPAYLKEHFGRDLCFRGCISTAGPLAYGTVDDVVKNVNETLEIMTPGGGYHFAPTHAIQDNSPTENVIAMYQAAHDFKLH